MKFSNAWLQQWVDPGLTAQELADQITMAGLEAGEVTAVGGAFSNVVVGEIVACEAHPDADKLRLCKVAGHPQGEMPVVCGAPNARPGIKVPFALVGARLPGDFKIKKARLRGVESLGMLCAQSELGLGEDSDGLWELPADAPTGMDLGEYLQLDDHTIEVELTPNRADCLSIAGIAREVAALNRRAVAMPEMAPVAPQLDDSLPVSLLAEEACPRYVGRIIRGIDSGAQTPLWMQERLRRSGLRSIDAVVDVTNYVLLELGQPLHAFDLEKLCGGIKVRYADTAEQLTLLDGKRIALQPGTLVIADEQKPLAIAGIMGGLDSAVTAATRDIFLESAFFSPLAIAGRARSYGLHTDASHRYERGVDYQLQEMAIERATQLLLTIAGGQPGPVHLRQLNASVPAQRRIYLRRQRIAQKLGVSIDDAEVIAIMARLGLEKMDQDSAGWHFLAPSFRFDLSIEADLLEELARVYGYNRIPGENLSGAQPMPQQSETEVSRQRLEQTLLARGYQEAITFSFVDRALARQFNPDVEPVALQNPISPELSVMRTSLMPGLIKALQYNLNRQQDRVRLFETGLRFVTGDRLQQQDMIAGLIYGARQPESWGGNRDKVDFYDIKADVEALLSHFSAADEIRFSPVPSTQPQRALHPGQSAEVLRNGQRIGVLGALHPQLQKSLGLPRAPLLFELDRGALGSARLPEFAALSKFPEVRRDLAFLVDSEVAAGDIVETATAVAGSYLSGVRLFDVYHGEGIDSDRKSIAIGLIFQHPSRTLNDSEINAAVAAVVTELEKKYNASLR